MGLGICFSLGAESKAGWMILGFFVGGGLSVNMSADSYDDVEALFVVVEDALGGSITEVGYRC